MRTPAWILLAIAAPAGPRQGEDRPPAPTSFAPFAVADSREVRELFQDAEEHFASARWSQGLARLQKIIEEHPDELLAVTAEGGMYRGSAKYAGAAAHCEERIGFLPPEARESYQSTYGPQAQSALAEGRQRRDPAALLKAAQRFARTKEGRQAFLLLGDLAFEEGDLALARQHYRRVEELGEESEREAPSLRIEMLSRTRGAARGSDGLQAADPRALPPDPPSPTQPAWRFASREGFFARPFVGDTPFSDPLYNLVPTIVGDSVLFSDSLGARALDLYSGKELWQFPGASGWERIPEREKKFDFFGAGINPHVLVAGAASQGICVFPLQVPLKLHESDSYQGIPIKTVIPTRRLFAFDVSTGRLLWSHWRPELARLGVGELTDRTGVAAPPLVEGGRVYAPIYRMEGKIDLYLACFDLRSGRTIWKTPVVTGQLELNMFGRAIREFAGSPPLLRDGRLYFSTNLGVLACVDASLGRVLWMARYDQIQIPPAMSYQRAPRVFFWANQPPAMDEGTLYVTPLDSEFFYAVDAAKGEILSRLHYNRLESGFRFNTGLRHLLGVADGKVVLYGAWAVALAARDGLGVPRFAPLWKRQVLQNEITKSSLLPRGCLTERSVWIPALDGIVSLSLEDGSPSAEAIPWQARSRDQGNLLVAGGVTLSLSDFSLEARFDWEALLRDARRLAAAKDPEAVERLGRLLRRRGDSFAQAGAGGFEKAVAAFAEASQILEGLAERGGPAASAELSDLYASLGELEMARARLAEAETYLRKAAQRAPTPEGKLEATLKLARLLEERGNRDAFEATLAALERDFAGVRRTIEGEGEVPIGLHVLLVRHRFHAAQRQWPQALAALQAMLRVYGSEHLDSGPAADFAREAVATILQSQGREFYAPYEEQARSLLERALEQKDREGLLQTIRLYPNAAGSSRAYRALAEMSLAAGDVSGVALVCRRYLGGETDEAGRAAMLRRLAAAFQRSGNEILAEAILRKLSRRFGPLASDLPEDGGKTYTELPRPPASRESIPGPRPPLSPEPEIAAAYGSLSVVPTLGEKASRLGFYLVNADQELICHRPAEPQGLTAPVWRLPLDRDEIGYPVAALSGHRLAIASGRRLHGLDLRTGETQWQRQVPTSILSDLTFARNGILVYLTQDRTGVHRCEAADAASGIPLWSLSLPGKHPPLPVLGDGEIAFLPATGSGDSVPVYDLLTGTLETTIRPPRPQEILAAAIAEEVLLLGYPPSIQRSDEPEERNPVLRGFPLGSGGAPWKADLPARSSLHSFLFAGEKPFLVLTFRDAREEGGAIYAVLAAEGRAVPLHSFPPGTFLPGLTMNLTNEVEEKSLLFLYPDPKGMLRAGLLDLESGKALWKRSLPYAASQIVDRESAPAPVWTSELLFLPLKIQRPTAAGSKVDVMVLDRNTSDTVGTSFSLGDMPPGAEMDLTALPGALVVQQALHLRRFTGK